MRKHTVGRQNRQQGNDAFQKEDKTLTYEVRNSQYKDFKRKTEKEQVKQVPITIRSTPRTQVPA